MMMTMQAAMSRCQANIMTDPSQTLDTLRLILQVTTVIIITTVVISAMTASLMTNLSSSQPDINMKIQSLLNEYLDSHFRPAFRNMKTNLGMWMRRTWQQEENI